MLKISPSFEHEPSIEQPHLMLDARGDPFIGLAQKLVGKTRDLVLNRLLLAAALIVDCGFLPSDIQSQADATFIDTIKGQHLAAGQQPVGEQPPNHHVVMEPVFVVDAAVVMLEINLFAQ